MLLRECTVYDSVYFLYTKLRTNVCCDVFTGKQLMLTRGSLVKSFTNKTALWRMIHSSCMHKERSLKIFRLKVCYLAHEIPCWISAMDTYSVHKWPTVLHYLWTGSAVYTVYRLQYNNLRTLRQNSCCSAA